MLKLFNAINKSRNNFISSYFFRVSLNVRYYLRMHIGCVRGILASLAGYVRYESDYRPLILGAGTQLLVRPGAAIVLKGKRVSKGSKKYNNNLVYKAASTIGTRPHFDVLDPPALNSTRIELLDGARLILDRNVLILTGTYISASNRSLVTIGEDCYVSQEVKINSRASVTIGKNVLIGYQTMIMDYDGHAILPIDDLNNPNPEVKSKPIVIEDNVWIGARVIILKGITIGSGSIIGANSCIVSDVPPNTIVAGNPAKVMRENISWLR